LEEGKEKEKDLSIHGDGGRHYADALDAASHGLLLLLLLALQGRAVQVDFNLSNDRPTSSTTLAPLPHPTPPFLTHIPVTSLFTRPRDGRRRGGVRARSAVFRNFFVRHVFNKKNSTSRDLNTN